jgi:hypothetical protein
MSSWRAWTWALSALVASAGCSVALPAEAQWQRPRKDDDHHRGLVTGAFLMLGPSLAWSFDRATGSGGGLGAEASLAQVNEELFWFGAYVDAQYAFAAGEARVSVGPEIGFSFLGIDGGYLLAAGGEHGTQHGLVVRPLLTIGFASAYFRSGWLLGERADWFCETGLLLKLPIELN